MFEWVLEYAIPFLFVLTVLVFVHELGHYLVARWNGVRVEIFSIGFGPEIFGWTDKAQTRWKFSAIPLGGYVKMFGEGNGEEIAESELVALARLRAENANAAVISANPELDDRVAIVELQEEEARGSDDAVRMKVSLTTGSAGQAP